MTVANVKRLYLTKLYAVFVNGKMVSKPTKSYTKAVQLAEKLNGKKDDLRCDECGHLRDNFDQARSCCTMQGSPCPHCESARRLKTGDEVRSLLRRQTGRIDRMDGHDAAYVHWNDGSEQLCLLTDLEFTYTADPRD